MSRRRIYVDGRPQWAPNEPGYVAVAKGHGGAALGFFEGVTLTAKQRRANEPRKKLARAPLDRREREDRE